MKENSIIKLECKYYLPCGRCDKTNGLCSLLDSIELPADPTIVSAANPFYVPADNGGVTPV